jgi:hypothetical protein
MEFLTDYEFWVGLFAIIGFMWVLISLGKFIGEIINGKD